MSKVFNNPDFDFSTVCYIECEKSAEVEALIQKARQLESKQDFPCGLRLCFMCGRPKHSEMTFAGMKIIFCIEELNDGNIHSYPNGARACDCCRCKI